MNQPRAAGNAQAAIQHHAHRRAGRHARQAAGQKRIVRPHGADPDQDGVALRAQQMYPRLCGFARYRDRLVAGRADLVVGRHRQFQDYVGTPVSDAPEVSGMIARGFSRAEPDIHSDARGAKFCMALAGDLPTCEHGSSVT